jgi:hypothetical protein
MVNDSSFLLRDGVLAWLETVGTNQALKVSTSQGTSTLLSALYGVRLLDSDAGQVAYGDATHGEAYSWDAATGQSTLRSDYVPGYALLSQGRLYFVVGATQSVYKVPL